MRQKMKQLMGILLSLVMVLGLMPGMSLTAYADGAPPYASLKNTTTVITFDGKSWYLIDYDAGTVTLLAKECVGASKYNESGKFVEYSSNPTVKTAVDNWYRENITAGAQKAVSAGMFLLTTAQASTIYNVKPDVLKCSQASDTDYDGWWLCSQGSNGDFAAFVLGGSGAVYGTGDDVQSTLGVRPALKLNLSSVIFSSVNLSGGANATPGGGSITQNYFDVGTIRGSMTAVTYTAKSGYKFPETSDYYTTTNVIKVERTSDTVVTVSGTPDGVANITVPDAVHFHSFTYSASGAGITATCGNNGCGLTDSKATLAIDAPTMTTYGQTGEGISEATLNGLEAFNTATGLSVSSDSILYYKATKIDTTYTKSGNALSAAPTDAGDYLAEITLSGVKTSAGENQSVTASVGYSIAQATPTITTAPTAGEITYGQTLADSTLTGGGASVAGSFAWKDSTVAPAVSDSQTTEYDVVFTPTDGNYGTTECKVKLTVKKADSAVTKAPEAKTLTYTGSAQELVTAGTATGGTMQYALGENATTAPAENLYTTSIPTATNAGTYYVWYKAVGDENHIDTESGYIEVTIAAASVSPPSISKHLTVTLPGLNPDGSDCEAWLFYPTKQIFYNGKKHVWTGTELTGRQKKNRGADLDIDVSGLPWTVVSEFKYSKNIKASDGKAYYYMGLKPNKASASYNALSPEAKKKLKGAVNKANKILKKKANRVYFSIGKLDLSGFAFDSGKSKKGKYVFTRKDGSGDTLTYRKETYEYMDGFEYKKRTKYVLMADLSGHDFEIGEREYRKTYSNGVITIKGKDKNLTGEMSGSLHR